MFSSTAFSSSFSSSFAGLGVPPEYYSMTISAFEIDNLYAGNNTPYARVDGLTRTDTKSRIDDATVEITFYDENDVEVSGATWPVTLDAEGSGGNYNGALPYGLVTANKEYRIVCDITSGMNKFQAETEKTIRIRRLI